jgi:hypothetical protein
MHLVYQKHRKTDLAEMDMTDRLCGRYNSDFLVGPQKPI